MSVPCCISSSVYECHVSTRILYADIVNFTPLSEKFTPPELVQILNKLFGKFDRLAQVMNFSLDGSFDGFLFEGM